MQALRSRAAARRAPRAASAAGSARAGRRAAGGRRCEPPLLRSASPAPASPGVPETYSGRPARPPARVSARARAARSPSSCTRDAQRAARGVAADQRHLVRPGQRAEAGGELRQPALVRLRQREREQRPGGARAHRGQVAQVHRQRAVADRGRRGEPGGKCTPATSVSVVATSSHRRRAPEQRGVVADAERHVGALRAAGAEVARRSARIPTAAWLPAASAAQCSSGRSVRAARSSTALTNLWPSVAPKRRASSPPR